MRYREEQDTMGKILVPEDAYYGAQTQRALDNFSIGGVALPPSFIRATAMIKKHAAAVNLDLGMLDREKSGAIIAAAGEVQDGRLADQFQVDVFQTGSGTSTNMNVNEVIASRANEILTGFRSVRSPIHPNDHVNMGQSSNDVIPAALHVAALLAVRTRLTPAMEKLQTGLEKKRVEFAGIRKIGRTHLQDAVPMSLGDEFGGYARQIELGIRRIRACQDRLSELALGGTAVGSGLNAHPQFAGKVIAAIAAETLCPFREAENHFEAQAAQDAGVETSGALKTVAVGLKKIADDVRWLASGPRCGFGEITLPSLQPGSSIMPGKVNPVIPEAVIQAAAQVIGNDCAITFGGLGGHFELNLMLPLIAHNLLQSIELLTRAATHLAEKCIDGITANEDRCRSLIELSLAVCTPLVPLIGYEKAAAIAKKAFTQGRTIRQVALEEGILPEEELNMVLDDAISGKVGA
ncbi:MAG: class II fumarate hydratase [Pseudomonadota bacterium]